MLPIEFSERMKSDLSDEYPLFVASFDRPRQTALRINPRKLAALPTAFCADPVPWEPLGGYLLPDTRPGLHPLHEAGAYYLQEPSAMAPAVLLDAQPGDRVLDLCAAPGGKSTQLAAAMKGNGILMCNEIHPKRARILSSNIERLGFENVIVLNEHPARLAERFPNYFDRILVDAPCSGEGMFRKEEAAVSDWSPEIVSMCAQRQLEILHSASEMLAPGGRLVYSTCTFSASENEGTINAFLKAHREFSVESVEAPWFSPGRPDLVTDPEPGLEHTFRLWPHKLKGEGHFAAVLRKNNEGERSQPPIFAPMPIDKAVPKELLPEGIPMLLAGGILSIAPPETPQSLRGLHVLRCGLEVGEARKGRFIPSHALSHWLTDHPDSISYPSDSPEVAAYLHGEAIPGTQKGWLLFQADGVTLGWVKGDGLFLKNHYPKGLRR